MGDVVVNLFHGLEQDMDSVQHVVDGGAEPLDFFQPAFDADPPFVGPF